MAFLTARPAGSESGRGLPQSTMLRVTPERGGPPGFGVRPRSCRFGIVRNPRLKRGISRNVSRRDQKR